MSFRDNLQYLRTQRGMTQEQLAMLLGVSRQSISKWESEKAYPEMDKLLTICDLFGCTLDDLVLGDVHQPGSGAESSRRSVANAETAPSVEASDIQGVQAFNTMAKPVPTQNRPDAGLHGIAPTGNTLAKDMTGYDVHMNHFAWQVSLGVAAIILGVAVGLLASDEHIFATSSVGDFLLVLFIIVGVVAGLAFLIPGGIEHGEFRRRHPYVEDFYTEADRSQASKQLALGLVGGIGLILLGVVSVVLSGQMTGDEEAGWPVSILLVAVSIGVWSMIFFGMRFGKLDLGEYNKEAELERERNSGTDDEKAWGNIKGSVNGIIMLLATIIGLVLMFAGRSFGPWAQTLFWLAWPVGGLLCGIVSMIIDIIRDRDKVRRTR